MIEPSGAAHPGVESPVDLLTTTRSVRRRLDLDRPVPREAVARSLEIAAQAPTGGATLRAHWVVLGPGPDLDRIAELYRETWFASYGPLLDSARAAGDIPKDLDSARYLATNLHRVPVFVLGFLDSDLASGNQASAWGSLLPAAWNLALAVRTEGLVSAWTTTLNAREAEVRELLQVPTQMRLGVALPVAFPRGNRFWPARREGLADRIHWGRW